MKVATTPSVVEQVSADRAREELAKFFVIADLAERAPGMFSTYIDAEWHRLMETTDYPDFCMTAVGHHVMHAPINGEGEVSWVDLYHGRFGALPATWFADADGSVDQDAYDRYLTTRTVTACWNCGPTTGDPDNN